MRGVTVENGAGAGVGGTATAAASGGGWPGIYGSEQIAGGDVFPGSSAANAAADLMSYDYANGGYTGTGKEESYRDQEYVYKMERSSAGIFNHYLYKADGTTLINLDRNTGAAWVRGPQNGTEGNNLPNQLRDEDNTLYLGFIVYGVTVEISDIKIYEEGNVVWEDPDVQGADLAVDQPKDIVISVTNANTVVSSGASGFVINSDDWLSNVTLTPKVVPVTLPDSSKGVTWGATNNSGIFNVNQDGSAYLLMRGANNGTGNASVTVTSNTLNSVNKTYTIEVQSVTPATSVDTIVKDNSILMFGDTTDAKAGTSAVLSTAVQPPNAAQAVTWELFSDAGATTPLAATVATIAGTGVTATVTAVANQAGDQTIYAVATATGTSIKSTTFTILIKGYLEANYPLVWVFDKDVPLSGTIPSNGNNGIVNGKVFATMSNTVALDTDNSLKLTAGRFLLGTSTTTATTDVLRVQGTLNLSKKFKITLKIAGGTGGFYLYLNNNGTSGANAITIKSVGAALPITTTIDPPNTNAGNSADSVILRFNPMQADQADTVTVTVNPSDFALTSAFLATTVTGEANEGVTLADVLSTSFLHFRKETADTSIDFDLIKIEHVE